MSNQDPVAATVHESISLWLQNEIPDGPPYGGLTPKASGLLMDIVSRVKKARTPDRPLEFHSMVSAKTQEPMIRIVWGDYEGQILPSEARELCLNLLDVAHAAEADSFLYALIVDHLGLEKEAAYQMLNEFRSWREKMAQMQIEGGSRARVTINPEERQPDEPVS